MTEIGAKKETEGRKRREHPLQFVFLLSFQILSVLYEEFLQHDDKIFLFYVVRWCCGANEGLITCPQACQSLTKGCVMR